VVFEQLIDVSFVKDTLGVGLDIKLNVFVDLQPFESITLNVYVPVVET
jgi:hypothetical protein